MPNLSTAAAVALTLLGAVYLSSYSTGPARGGNDATSSGLGRTLCGSCHRGGDFGTATAVQLLDPGGRPLMAYVPGETYRLRVSIATARRPGGYGLQALIVDGDRAQAGTFGQPPEGLRVTTLDARSYFEHARRLSDSTAEISWTAPAAGTGPVTIYAVGNAVNANGGTSGDQTNETVVTLPEDMGSSLSELAPVTVSAYSPAAGALVLARDTPAGAGVDYTVTLADLSGRTLWVGAWPPHERTLHIDGLPAGLLAWHLHAGFRHVGARLAYVR